MSTNLLEVDSAEADPNPRRRIGSIAIGLRTLFVIVGLCSTTIALWQARSAIAVQQTELEQAVFLAGGTVRGDWDDAQLQVVDVTMNEKLVWVPHRRTGQIMYQTHDLDLKDTTPGLTTGLPLVAGLNRVRLQRSGAGPWLIHVGDQLLFSRIPDRQWNIQLRGGRNRGPELSAPPGIPGDPQIVFNARGTARLTSEEIYDPKKHSFGLRVWAQLD